MAEHPVEARDGLADLSQTEQHLEVRQTKSIGLARLKFVILAFQPLGLHSCVYK